MLKVVSCPHCPDIWVWNNEVGQEIGGRATCGNCGKPYAIPTPKEMPESVFEALKKRSREDG